MGKNGPGHFSEIGKKAKELLTKDYDSDQTFTVTTNTDTGVALSSTVAKKGRLSSGHVAARYKYKNAVFDVQVDTGSNALSSTVAKKGRLSSGHVAARYKYKNSVFDVKVDTGSNVLTTFTLTGIPPSTKTIASFKLHDYKSGKLKAQYCHEHATFTAAVGLNQSPAFDFSGTIGNPSIAFGAEAIYVAASRNFAKYSAGVSLTKPDSSASVILADKGDSLRVSYLHHLSRLNGGAVAGEISRRFSTNENTLTVGCSYVVDPHTVVKAKLNNHGNLGALLRHELIPESFLTISGAFDTKNLEKYPKFGLALSLKP